MIHCSNFESLRVAFVLLKEAVRKPLNVALYTEARDVLIGRGIDTDRILNENGIPNPQL